MIRLFAQVMKEIKPETDLGECINSLQVVSSPEGLDLSKGEKIPVVEFDVKYPVVQHFLEDHDNVTGSFAHILKEAVKAGFALAQEIKKKQHKE